MAILALEGMEFHGFHGYYAEERKIGGRYGVDVYITLKDAGTGITDNLGDTLNYEVIYAIVCKVMSVPTHLIEHLARNIIDRIRKDAGVAQNIRVRVRKFRPPLSGEVGCAYIELEG